MWQEVTAELEQTHTETLQIMGRPRNHRMLTGRDCPVTHVYTTQHCSTSRGDSGVKQSSDQRRQTVRKLFVTGTPSSYLTKPNQRPLAFPAKNVVSKTHLSRPWEKALRRWCVVNKSRRICSEAGSTADGKDTKAGKENPAVCLTRDRPDLLCGVTAS